MRTHNIPSCQRKLKRYLYFALDSCAMINAHYFELPLSRTYFHSLKGFRAIEVRLYNVMLFTPHIPPPLFCFFMRHEVEITRTFSVMLTCKKW